MRGILGTTLAICLLGGTSVLAQTEDHRGQDRPDRPDRPAARPATPPATTPPRPTPPAGGGQTATPRPAPPAAPPAAPPGGGYGQRGGGQNGVWPRPGGFDGQRAAAPPGQPAQPAPPAPPSAFRNGQEPFRGFANPPTRAPDAQPRDRQGPGGPGDNRRGPPNGWQDGRDRPDAGRGPDAYRGGPDRRDGDRGDYRDNRDRRDGDRGGWDRRGDGQRPAYDPNRYPRQFHSPDRYRWRGGEWRAPPGFFYRHWNYGEYLPRGWFSDDWFIQDWWSYGLSIPPYGFEWVRSGPDALLVDERTGFVVQAVYGVFY